MKFQYYNEYLSAKSYDIATALRGPDTGETRFAVRVKRIFTFAIRRHARCADRACDGNFGDLPTQEYIEQTLAIASTRRPPPWWPHWSTHTHIALSWMGHAELQVLLRDIEGAFLGPTQSHGGFDGDLKKLYYCIASGGNRYTTFHLSLELSARRWGLGPTFYVSRKGWGAGLHLLCLHVETSGWFKRR